MTRSRVLTYRLSLAFFSLIAIAGNVRGAFTAVYQYQVPVVPPYVGHADPERRAYLWVPPACTQVKALLVGLQNMSEQPIFENASIRSACTAANVAIVWISPGYATGDTAGPNMCLTLDPGSSSLLSGAIPAGKTADQECADELSAVLTQLAAKSGYTEIQYAPMILLGHSAATPFVWSRSVAISGDLMGRVIALLPWKGWFPGTCVTGIPVMYVDQEWEEVDSSWGTKWSSNQTTLKNLRGKSGNTLLGEFVPFGVGHYDAFQNDAALAPVCEFIKATVAARVPSGWPGTFKPVLNATPENSGYLIDPAKIGTTSAVPISYSTWTGSGKSSTSAYWYVNQTVAQSVCDYMNSACGKSPQMINVYQDPNHTLAPISDTSANGLADYTPTMQADGLNFKLDATYLTTSPTTRQYNGLTLGHSSTAILYKANGSGGLIQTGTNTFRIWIGRGSVARQGLPWEPFVIAYNTGDSSYRGADRPVHIQLATRLTTGTTQTINFPAIPDQSSTAMQSITLNATSSSGRGVQYWVVAGPYQMNGITNVLTPTTIPVKTKLPMEVVIGAYQWGTLGSLQSAGPVFRTFYVR